MTPFEFIVLVLAVHRVTHLVVEDSFPPVAWLRGVLSRKPSGWVSYLVNCFWCSSVWVSAGAVGAAYLFTPAHWHGVAAPLVLGAGLSTAATTIESVLQLLDAVALRAGGDG